MVAWQNRICQPVPMAGTAAGTEMGLTKKKRRKRAASCLHRSLLAEKKTCCVLFASVSLGRQGQAGCWLAYRSQGGGNSSFRLEWLVTRGVPCVAQLPSCPSNVGAIVLLGRRVQGQSGPAVCRRGGGGSRGPAVAPRRAGAAGSRGTVSRLAGDGRGGGISSGVRAAVAVPRAPRAAGGTDEACSSDEACSCSDCRGG